MMTNWENSKTWVLSWKGLYPVSILYKSIAGRYRPVSYPDGPITARYRFIKNAYWVVVTPTPYTTVFIAYADNKSLHINAVRSRYFWLCILYYLKKKSVLWYYDSYYATIISTLSALILWLVGNIALISSSIKPHVSVAKYVLILFHSDPNM